MLEAVGKSRSVRKHLLIDAMLDVQVPQTSIIIKGDANSLSIAGRFNRSQWLEIGDDNYELTYPGYDFAHNVGYGTQHHLEGLNERESPGQILNQLNACLKKSRTRDDCY